MRSRQAIQPAVWFGIAMLALAVRLLAAVVLGGFHHPELFEYEDIARSLIAGQGFVYPHLHVLYYSYSPPLYPWICAGIYLITGGAVWAVLLLQMIVSSAHVILVGALARRIFGAAAGIVAALLMAFHPGLIVYCSLKAHPLTFDAFFFTAILWCFLALRDRPTVGRAVWTGLIVGLGVLSRATAVVFFAVGAVWLLWGASVQERPTALRHVTVAAVCAFLVVAPWTIRNIVIHRQFVFQVTVDSEVFWRGNNPAATGHSYVDANRTVLDQLPPAARAELYSLPDEIQQSHWFRDRATEFIRAEPAAFVRLTARKLRSFWWLAPQTGVRYPASWRVGYQLYYVPILCLAIVGVVNVIRHGSVLVRRDVLLLGLFLLSLSASQSLFYVEGRHRWAVEPMMIVLAGGGAATLVRRRAQVPAVARVEGAS